MSVLTIFIQKAIVQGICILYGALGEIMTEKSGNLNLGIPGIMYMGGIAGLMGAFGAALIAVLAFGAYQQPELLLNIIGLRYCG